MASDFRNLWNDWRSFFGDLDLSQHVLLARPQVGSKASLAFGNFTLTVCVESVHNLGTSQTVELLRQRNLEQKHSENTQKQKLEIADNFLETEQDILRHRIRGCTFLEVAVPSGLLVRLGKMLNSRTKPIRLALGAVMKVIQREDNRLCYEKVSGEGPSCGWISIEANDKILVRPMDLPSGTSVTEVRNRSLSRKLAIQDTTDNSRRSQRANLSRSPTPRKRWHSPRPFKVDLALARPDKHRIEAKLAKLRILALHGGGSNSRILDYQTSFLKNHSLLKGKVDLHILEGTIPWAGPSLFETEGMKALAKGTPLYAYIEQDGRRMLDAADTLLDYIHNNGPFDVVLGFSQSCALIGLALAVLRDRGEVTPWDLSLLFNCAHVAVRPQERHPSFFQSTLDMPTVIVLGESDPFYPVGVEEVKLYEDPVVLVHSEGHEFPSLNARGVEIYDKIARQILSL